MCACVCVHVCVCMCVCACVCVHVCVDMCVAQYRETLWQIRTGTGRIACEKECVLICVSRSIARRSGQVRTETGWIV